MRSLRVFFFWCIIGVVPVYGASPELLKQIKAVPLSEPIHIDGFLSESVYQQPGETKFFQSDPNQGEPVTESTEVWVVYDNEALFVSARLRDLHPDSIYAWLSRRDTDIGADMFGVGIDSYHDKRSGYYFKISAAGTLQDGILYNDDWSDATWDGVWEGQCQLTPEGWSVEMRIPFSQLRFKEQESYTWGINFERKIGRKKESALLVYTPRNESGFVSRFPVLTGIERIQPSHRFEIRPYMTMKQEFVQHEPGDPFNSGKKFTPDFGGDFKLGIGTNLTLDGTVNPDFGQVEVDPAVVNLSDAETYYDEKRPFFIEGMNIFSFGQGGVNNYWTFNWSNPNLFYSRRIGRAPQRELPDYDYADVPQGTRILGAAKITGKVSDTWNIGFIEAVTNREHAQIDTSGVRRDFEVEPLASYTIARVQRDFNNGKQGIGLLTNYTHRFFKNEGVRSDVNSHAFLGGLDGWTALDDDKEYVVSGWAAFSDVHGSKERIADLQTGWPHYFERPDAHHVSVDTNVTSLKGSAARITMNKQKGRMFLNSSIGYVSPGFEPGDLGFINRADVINYHIAAGYKWNEPTEYYRYINIYGSYFQTLDFGGNTLWRGIWGRLNYQFTNYHTFGFYGDYGFESINKQQTRGGPLTLNPSAYEGGLEYYTDSRSDYIGEAYWYFFKTRYEIYNNYEMYFTLRPVSNISLTIGPRYMATTDQIAWVNSDSNPISDPSAVFTYGKRYIFAELHQKEFSIIVRVNWTFTPALSLQLYAQQLFSAGRYSQFKHLAKERTMDYTPYGTGGTLIFDSTASVGNYYLDPDGAGPVAPAAFENPDFNKVSLRGNAVLRWEYMPGSTIYLVWTQSRFEDDGYGRLAFNRSYNLLTNAKPDNIFMLKVTYWIGG